MHQSFRERYGPLLRRMVRSSIFEPALSVVIILLVILSLYAYTDNWPPMVVIESGSMQHGTNDVLGVINTGDIVLVKKVPVPDGVTTYVDGEASGYSTYGEYGDVLLYSPNGNTGMTPVIHRAIVWLVYTGASTGYEIPSLLQLPCTVGSYPDYEIRDPGSGSPHCIQPNQAELGTLLLFHVGWNSLNVSIDLGSIASRAPWSGYVTLGDNNSGVYDQSPAGSGCQISCLVQPGWVVGVARGMIPWFGALKLWLDGSSRSVPPQSWVYLAASIVLIVALPQVIPYLIRKARSRPRRRHGGPSEGKEGALRWEDVAKLRFRQESIGTSLVRVDMVTIRPHFLGGVRRVRASEKLELGVTEIVDLRQDARPRDVRGYLDQRDAFVLDPPAPVKLRTISGTATLTIGVPENEVRAQKGSKGSQGTWMGHA